MHRLSLNRRPVRRYRTVDTVTQAAILLALGFGWAAAGLMIMASVVTLVLSAPSLLVIVGLLTTGVVVFKATVKGATVPRHAPPAQ